MERDTRSDSIVKLLDGWKGEACLPFESQLLWLMTYDLCACSVHWMLQSHMARWAGTCLRPSYWTGWFTWKLRRGEACSWPRFLRRFWIGQLDANGVCAASEYGWVWHSDVIFAREFWSLTISKCYAILDGSPVNMLVLSRTDSVQQRIRENMTQPDAACLQEWFQHITSNILKLSQTQIEHAELTILRPNLEVRFV